MRRDELLRRMNKLNAMDPMVRNVMEAVAAEMDISDAQVQQLADDMFFDSCSEAMLDFYEREAAVTPMAGQDLDGRRASVEAKWKSSGKVDIEMLQVVADSWKNGKVDVDFVDNKIQITFVDQFGLPADRAGLEMAMDEVKPAHLPIVYFVRYIMVADVEAVSLTELQSHTLSDFAFE